MEESFYLQPIYSYPVRLLGRTVTGAKRILLRTRRNLLDGERGAGYLKVAQSAEIKLEGTNPREGTMVQRRS